MYILTETRPYISPKWIARLLTCLTLGVVAAGCGDDPTGLEDDENSDDPCVAWTAVAMGQSLSGTLSAGDCVHATGVLGDRFGLTLTAETNVRIDLTTSAFDAFLELHTASGSVIATNDDAGGSLDSRIVETLAAGSYVIVARSLSSGQNGAYRLSVTEGPDCSVVGTIQLGTSVNGTLTGDDCLFEFGGLIDNWTLDLSQREKLRIDLKSSDFDEVVLVQDVTGNIVWFGAWDAPIGHARIEAELPPGEWTIAVGSPFDFSRGDYELTVEVAPACTPGDVLVLGESVEGTITGNECLFDGWTPADSFAVVLAEEMSVSLHMKSADTRPLLILRDASGTDVAVAFDEFNDGNARLQVVLAAGSYALFAIADGFPPRGTYRLTFEEVTCDEPSAIAFGATEQGSLDTTDCQRAGGAYREEWEFVLDVETPVRIDLTSADFDTFLSLFDAAGVHLASDDDGGPGLNSRLELTLAAGTYRVMASSFSPNQIGEYSLTVGSPPPATAAAVSPGSVEFNLGRPKVSSSHEEPATLAPVRRHVLRRRSPYITV